MSGDNSTACRGDESRLFPLLLGKSIEMEYHRDRGIWECQLSDIPFVIMGNSGTVDRICSEIIIFKM